MPRRWRRSRSVRRSFNDANCNHEDAKTRRISWQVGQVGRVGQVGGWGWGGVPLPNPPGLPDPRDDGR